MSTEYIEHSGRPKERIIKTGPFEINQAAERLMSSSCSALDARRFGSEINNCSSLAPPPPPHYRHRYTLSATPSLN
ncbi:hypothetical protein GWI33_018221 [Rhynchophorus ferrugineus]|uniref:Uncharacterized protein n=1 Tax=Rhynchophorus ferrugineus TaxID=354439 RepID=A0A834M6N2_RHYFE|nr:hypothetical protein GWI33_018221 [Rhynchophorus ferrugineus]